MSSAEAKAAGIACVQKRVVLDFVVSVGVDGVAILPLSMAMTRSVFVGELFIVFVAEE